MSKMDLQRVYTCRTFEKKWPRTLAAAGYRRLKLGQKGGVSANTRTARTPGRSLARPCPGRRGRCGVAEAIRASLLIAACLAFSTGGRKQPFPPFLACLQNFRPAPSPAPSQEDLKHGGRLFLHRHQAGPKGTEGIPSRGRAPGFAFPCEERGTCRALDIARLEKRPPPLRSPEAEVGRLSDSDSRGYLAKGKRCRVTLARVVSLR